MFAIAYRFPVLTRHRDAFRHAWQAAREAFRQTPGLVSFEFLAPQGPQDAFTLLLAWEGRASFERFTRTWIGVWLLNGLGFERHDFHSPIVTLVGEAAIAAWSSEEAV